MLRQIQRFFGFQDPKSIKKPNKLQVRLAEYCVDFGTSSKSGSACTFDIDEFTCDKIMERIFIPPGTTPEISLTLILSGHWNGVDINKEFSDLNSFQKYLADNFMISKSEKESKFVINN